MSSIQDTKTKDEQKPAMPKPMSEAEKDATIRWTVTSMALEGLEISYEEVAELLEETLSEPLEELG